MLYIDMYINMRRYQNTLSFITDFQKQRTFILQISEKKDIIAVNITVK